MVRWVGWGARRAVDVATSGFVAGVRDGGFCSSAVRLGGRRLQIAGTVRTGFALCSVEPFLSQRTRWRRRSQEPARLLTPGVCSRADRARPSGSFCGLVARGGCREVEVPAPEFLGLDVVAHGLVQAGASICLGESL